MFSILNSGKQILPKALSTIRLTTNSFYKIQSNSLITGKLRKKSIFDQSHFNPYHIAFKADINKKPVQDKFDDEDYTIESIPSPVKESGKELLTIIRKEEMEKIKAQGLKKDKIALGDKIEVEYYHSITSKKLYKYKGVVVSLKRLNSLTFSFKFLTMVAGSFAILEYPYYSPMLNSVKVIQKNTSNKTKNRRKIYSISHIKEFGWRLNELLKGGKNVTVNKRKTRELRKKESKSESIILE